MKKLTRKSLDELALRMPVLSEEVQSTFIGGGDGSENNPFTLSAYKDLSRQFRFNSGWVDWDSCSDPELMTKDYYSYMGISRFEDMNWSGGMSGGMSGNINPPFLESDFCYKRSCVFDCFDYLDGDSHSWRYYSEKYLKSGGAVGNDGGISNDDDIIKIASFGGFNVRRATSKDDLLAMINRIERDGTVDGERVMMRIPTATIDHAVIVTGYIWDVEKEKYMISYYDPKKNKSEFIYHGDIKNLYTISKK